MPTTSLPGPLSPTEAIVSSQMSSSSRMPQSGSRYLSENPSSPVNTLRWTKIGASGCRQRTPTLITSLTMTNALLSPSTTSSVIRIRPLRCSNNFSSTTKLTTQMRTPKLLWHPSSRSSSTLPRSSTPPNQLWMILDRNGNIIPCSLSSTVDSHVHNPDDESMSAGPGIYDNYKCQINACGETSDYKRD